MIASHHGIESRLWRVQIVVRMPWFSCKGSVNRIYDCGCPPFSLWFDSCLICVTSSPSCVCDDPDSHNAPICV